MKALVQYKEQAIEFRKKGYSYKEILAELPVAKSSLSLWLKDTPLTLTEKMVLRNRIDSNISRGRIKAAAAARNNRLERERARLPEIKRLFEKYKNDTLFQLGIGLYWAEGAKSSGSVLFVNSDASMVNIILKWIETYTEYSRVDLRYRLYVHKPYVHEECDKWWAKVLQVPLTQFTAISYKPTSKGVKIRKNYKGCMRVEVPKSTILLHSFKIWTSMLVEYHNKK
jgi:hypothetical protein